MNITVDKYEITLSREELWLIAFNVRNSLYETFKNHWINHQNSWKEHEKQRINIIKEMFYSLGRPDLYDEIDIKAKDIFNEFNKN